MAPEKPLHSLQLALGVLAMLVVASVGAFALSWYVWDGTAVAREAHANQQRAQVQLAFAERPVLPLAAQALPAEVSTSVPPAPVRELLPRYVENARPVSLTGQPMVAIVIDDMGVHDAHTRAVLKNLPPEITLSFLPYGKSTPDLAFQAKVLGHEIMIHLPMEPEPHGLDGEGKMAANPGPGALRVGMGVDEITALTNRNMAALAPLSVGVNNHMGSKFTAWREGMVPVLHAVAAERLFFLDSLTTPQSAVKLAEVLAAGQGINIPLLTRNVFIDHESGQPAAKAALEKLVAEAHKNGSAIAIGHPHPDTVAAIAAWLPTLGDKNVQLVPISTLVHKER